jgi:hypothetical protein
MALTIEDEIMALDNMIKTEIDSIIDKYTQMKNKIYMDKLEKKSILNMFDPLNESSEETNNKPSSPLENKKTEHEFLKETNISKKHQPTKKELLELKNQQVEKNKGELRTIRINKLGGNPSFTALLILKKHIAETYGVPNCVPL